MAPLDRDARVGVLVVGHDGALVTANQAARRLLDRGDGIAVRDGVVTAVRKRAAHQLASILASTANEKAAGQPRLLRIARVDSSDLRIAIMALDTRRSSPLGPRCCALLYVSPE